MATTREKTKDREGGVTKGWIAVHIRRDNDGAVVMEGVDVELAAIMETSLWRASISGLLTLVIPWVVGEVVSSMASAPDP